MELVIGSDTKTTLDIILYACIITSMTQQTRNSTNMKPTQKIGPKHRLVNPMPRNLMLTAEVIDKARRIGKGNLSGGVRKAVMEYPQDATTARTSDDRGAGDG